MSGKILKDFFADICALFSFRLNDYLAKSYEETHKICPKAKFVTRKNSLCHFEMCCKSFHSCLTNCERVCTVWKFGNYPAIQILRELNFCKSRVSKYATYLDSFSEFLHFFKAEINQKSKFTFHSL